MKNIVLVALGLFATSMVGIACTDLTGPESPETPVNVTATLLTGTSARIEWQASPQSDGVISYNIIRNGTKVGESPSTSFTDVGLAEQTKFEYSVSANCLSGLLSDASPVTAASTITTLDVTAPRVTFISPANGSTNVSLVGTARVAFSEAMNPATLNVTTFFMKVTGTGAVIPGAVVYTAATFSAEFKPDQGALPSATHVTVTVTTGAKDVAGNGLAANFTSSFTTRDEEPPRVIATNPTSGAGGISTTAPNISATFNEPMDANSINTTSFTLQLSSSGASVPGTVAYNPTTSTATFTPSAALTPGTEYTATIGASVKDLIGNLLGVPFQFTFTTGDSTPPSLILTTPANLTTGVPTNAVVTAAFNERMDPTTITAATFTLKVGATGVAVPGSVGYNVATATATFTPTAALLPSTPYIATVTTGAKDLAGNALAPSVIPNPWTFTTAGAPTVASTTPADLASNVPTNTTLTATFNEPMDGTTITTSTFTLRTTVGNTPVTGTVAYSAGTNTATFTPSSQLTASTAYTATITTGAKNASGTALAGPYTWTFSTVDNVAPTVTGVTPSAGAPPVAPNTPVNITFSEAMDQTTINGANISVKNSFTNAAVAGTVGYNSTTRVATFTPSGQATGTGYTITVTTGVKDVAGNAMAAQFTSTYSTTAAPDNTAPTVISVSPGTNAPPNTKVYVTFSEPMDPATINGTTNVTLRVTSPPSAAVAGTLTYNAAMNMAIFSPTSPLTASTGYTVTVTTGVKDVAGNALASQETRTFTTTAGADATAPTATISSPAAGATGVSVNSAVTVTFSEGMDPTTINGTTFTLKVTSGGAVAGTIAYNSSTNVAVYTPTASLTANTNYTVTVTTGVKDLAGNAMAAQVTSTFATAP